VFLGQGSWRIAATMVGFPVALVISILAISPVASLSSALADRGSSDIQSAHVMCFDGEQPVPKVHPARCDIFGEPEDEADLIRLAGAHWTGWGTATADATATALPNKPSEEQAVSVTVTLSRLRRRCGGRLFYTHLVAVKTSGVSDWFDAQNRRVLNLSGACHEIPF
jgi:hypothetical protein